jgi:hypothetical protein
VIEAQLAIPSSEHPSEREYVTLRLDEDVAFELLRQNVRDEVARLTSIRDMPAAAEGEQAEHLRLTAEHLAEALRGQEVIGMLKQKRDGLVSSPS